VSVLVPLTAPYCVCFTSDVAATSFSTLMVVSGAANTVRLEQLTIAMASDNAIILDNLFFIFSSPYSSQKVIT
jgi:hypothetical protein